MVSVAGLMCTSTFGTSFSKYALEVVAVTTRRISDVVPGMKNATRYKVSNTNYLSKLLSHNPNEVFRLLDFL